jgi:hypothetical protein
MSFDILTNRLPGYFLHRAVLKFRAPTQCVDLGIGEPKCHSHSIMVSSPIPPAVSDRSPTCSFPGQAASTVPVSNRGWPWFTARSGTEVARQPGGNPACGTCVPALLTSYATGGCHAAIRTCGSARSGEFLVEWRMSRRARSRVVRAHLSAGCVVFDEFSDVVWPFFLFRSS